MQSSPPKQGAPAAGIRAGRITALILCGGRSERLGAIDKPLRLLAGRPLVERVLTTLDRPHFEILISANRNADHYRRYADAVIDDGRHAYDGPLAGMAAGLAAAACDEVLCLPGDAPMLPPDLVDRLAAARRRDRCDIAVVHDGRGLQPLCLLLPRTKSESIQAFLDSGGRAVQRWLQSQPHAVCDCSDWPRWGWSVNTEEEWSAAERQLMSDSRP